MAETAPAATPAKPAKKKVTKPKRVGPSTRELVVKAIAASKERSGMSLAALKKALIAGGYDVEKNNARIKNTIKTLVANEVLDRTKGTGASGSFRISKKADKKAKKAAARKAAPKVKKPAAKKTAAVKKPKTAAKKSTTPKKSPKKVKKPAVAKKPAKSPKKVTKSPKKATKSPKKVAKKPAVKKVALKKTVKPKVKKAAPKKK